MSTWATKKIESMRATCLSLSIIYSRSLIRLCSFPCSCLPIYGRALWPSVAFCLFSLTDAAIYRDGFAALSRLPRVSPRLGSIARRRLHLRKHWALPIWILSLRVCSQWREIRSYGIRPPRRAVDPLPLKLVPLLLLMVHARCIGLGDRASGGCLRTCPNVSVWTRRAIWLAKATTVLLLRVLGLRLLLECRLVCNVW